MNEPVQMMLLGEAVEHASVGVVVWNAERRYVACNAKACALFGVSREQLLEQPVGANNRTTEAQEAIDSILGHAPSRGVTEVRGVDLEWVVFPTVLAGLQHVVGLMWEKTAL